MSVVRLIANRLTQHGRYFLQPQCRRKIHSKIIENTRNSRLTKSSTVKVSNPNQPPLFRFGQHVRRIFIDGVISSSSYVSELRKKAIQLAFVGVTLSSGAGLLSKDDEFEVVCCEIRDGVSRIQTAWNYEEISKCLNKEFGINELKIGPPIAKGCSAVVYSAALKKADLHSESKKSNVIKKAQNLNIERMSSIHNISRFIYSSNLDLPKIAKHERVKLIKQKSKSNEIKMKSKAANKEIKQKKSSTSIDRYPLALKMMFNYDIQSNAISIIRAMSKETIPARKRNNEIAKYLYDQVSVLPPHPNIVCMFGYFCAPVGDFDGGSDLYPSAQPPRINPDGYGRNMSLYLLMKRYDLSLSELLSSDEFQLSTRERVLLFVQLLEAICHLGRHGIAHRDLKSDNILIEYGEENFNKGCPALVLTDFGCCLANKLHGLRIPYISSDIDKGGNAALMAPEIITKEPGRFAVLDFTKSDLWACGTIAYEIFGLKNPFYSLGGRAEKLNNYDYNESDLPHLPESCPYIIKELILNILKPNQNERVSPEIAANIVQLYLWAPSNWLQPNDDDDEAPSSPEIIEWLLSLTYKLICEKTEYAKNYDVEYMLICNFLARVRLDGIKKALSWIRSNQENL